jgi:hypothetical protein
MVVAVPVSEFMFHVARGEYLIALKTTSVRRKKIKLKAKVAQGVLPSFPRRGARRAGRFKSK